jgi:hypothetical protein
MDVDINDSFSQEELNRRVQSLSKEGLATVKHINNKSLLNLCKLIVPKL